MFLLKFVEHYYHSFEKWLVLAVKCIRRLSICNIVARLSNQCNSKQTQQTKKHTREFLLEP